MMARVDAALLAFVQSVVDLLQRRPVVLARWCIMVMVALKFTQWVLLGPPSGSVLVMFGLGLLAVSVPAINDRLFVAVFGGTFIRRLELFLSTAHASLVILSQVLLGVGPDPVRGFEIAYWLPFLGYFYLASCRPPKPRPPRCVAASRALPSGAA